MNAKSTWSSQEERRDTESSPDTVPTLGQEINASDLSQSAAFPAPSETRGHATRLFRFVQLLSRRRVSDRLLGVAGVLTLVVLLEALPAFGVVDQTFLPRLSSMIQALAERAQTGAFWQALGDTITTWMIGLVIANVAGLILGALIGSMSFVRDLTSSTIEFLRPIPSVALIPLAVLLWGTGREATLLLVIYASFWQVLIPAIHGVQDVDPVARDTARSYRLRWSTRVSRLTLPTMLPYVLTGFRLSATIALILTITGELIISTPGLGQMIGVAQATGSVQLMYGLVIVTGILGLLVNVGARRFERLILHWHPSVRKGGMQ